MNIATSMTTITSTPTARTTRRASRIRTGIATRRCDTGTRTTPTCTTATGTRPWRSVQTARREKLRSPLSAATTRGRTPAGSTCRAQMKRATMGMRRRAMASSQLPAVARAITISALRIGEAAQRISPYCSQVTRP
jgi:hypothetical protein